MLENKLKVMYIGGCGRSGTTLLLRLLGQIDGFLPVGELWHIWYFGFTLNQLCGCGQPFRSCPFWNAVADEAFGGMDRIDVDGIRKLRRSVQNKRYAPMLAFPQLRTSDYQNRMTAYTSTLQAFYRGIQKVSGCRVIVDSSKGPRYATGLRETPDIDLYMVHLVRDSRAVAYSWLRKKQKPEVYWKTEYMDRQDVMKSALEWTTTNTLLHALSQTGIRYLNIRYEDVIRQPATALRSLATYVGEQNSAISIEGHTVHFGVDHTAVGNPNRFRHGSTTLRLDTEWQQQLARRDKHLVTALTWPLLRRYGYLGKTVT